jgi:DNA-directed RNA polymerase subunit M/transcription elongation factor TFIIS
MVAIGNCPSCGGLLTPVDNRFKCIFCGKKYELKDVYYAETK